MWDQEKCTKSVTWSIGIQTKWHAFEVQCHLDYCEKVYYLVPHLISSVTRVNVQANGQCITLYFLNAAILTSPDSNVSFSQINLSTSTSKACSVFSFWTSGIEERLMNGVLWRIHHIYSWAISRSVTGTLEILLLWNHSTLKSSAKKSPLQINWLSALWILPKKRFYS